MKCHKVRFQCATLYDTLRDFMALYNTLRHLTTPPERPLSGPPCFPAPLKTDTPLRGLWRATPGPWEPFQGSKGPLGGGFRDPEFAETRGRIPRPLREPKTSGPLSRVPPLAFRPLGHSWKRVTGQKNDSGNYVAEIYRYRSDRYLFDLFVCELPFPFLKSEAPGLPTWFLLQSCCFCFRQNLCPN